MSRRHVKEFRPDEALGLISADREGKPLTCPSCGAASVTRSPARPADGHAVEGPVTLACEACGRVVTYIDRGSALTALIVSGEATGIPQPNSACRPDDHRTSNRGRHRSATVVGRFSVVVPRVQARL